MSVESPSVDDPIASILGKLRSYAENRLRLLGFVQGAP